MEGLRYGSPMRASQPCVALHERALGAMPPHPAFNRLLSDPLLVTALKNACRALNDILA